MSSLPEIGVGIGIGTTTAGRRTHGGLHSAELDALGIVPADVIDFSVSCNAYGPCDEIIEAVRSAPVDRYPDPSACQARAAIGSLLGLDPDRIALGNGAAELLWTLADLLVRPGTGVVITEPTFCEFRAALEHRGGRVHEWRAGAADGFAIDLDAVGRLIRAQGATVLYLCAPNTPTGVAIPASAVARLAQAHPDLAIILDQSFLSLSERFRDIRVGLPDNVICVRSMTKDHAIPGVRVGYVVATPRIIAQLEASRPAWTTSAMAQAAAIAACRATDFVDRSRHQLLADRGHLAELLGELGLQPVSSTTCFLLVHTGSSQPLRHRLLAHHRILVRDCSSFGLPGYIRVAARPEPDSERLAAALRQELGSC